MNLFLDTHVVLWWLDDDPALVPRAREAISNTSNIVILSAAVIWEIRIKQAIGKLELPPNFYEVMKMQGFEMLPITSEHAYAVGDLPHHHRDPFDRILIAQALLENLIIVTHDAIFRKYPVGVMQI